MFLALWPGPAAREGVLRWQSAIDWPDGARRVDASQLHLTLHFVGAVARDRLAELAGALHHPCPRIELVLDGALVWPGGIAVLVPSRTPPALLDLHGRLGETLRAQGLPVEARPYRAHVTLARKATGAVLRQAPPPVRWRSQAWVLVESRGGYRVLARYA